MTKPFVHCDKVPLARRMAQECHPADVEPVDLADHLLKTYTPVAPGDLLKALFCAFEGLGSDPQSPTGQQAMGQEFAFLHERHRALFPVHTQFEFLFKESRHARQHLFSRHLGLHINIAIVCVAAELVPALSSDSSGTVNRPAADWPAAVKAARLAACPVPARRARRFASCRSVRTDRR